MSLQDVLYKLSKIESAVDNINLRLCSLENNLNSNSNRPLRSFNQRIPRNIFYSSNLPVITYLKISSNSLLFFTIAKADASTSLRAC